MCLEIYIYIRIYSHAFIHIHIHVTLTHCPTPPLLILTFTTPSTNSHPPKTKSYPPDLTLTLPFPTLIIALLTALLKHLVDVKLAHWDPEIRILAAKSLARLVIIGRGSEHTEIIRDVLPQCLSPTLAKRHGAILAIAEVVLAAAMTATSDNKLPFPEDIVAEIVSLIQRIDKVFIHTQMNLQKKKCICMYLYDFIFIY